MELSSREQREQADGNDKAGKETLTRMLTMVFQVHAGPSNYSLKLLCSLFAFPFPNLEQF